MLFDFRTTRIEDSVFDCEALDPVREPRLRDWLDLQETLGLQPERARDLLEALGFDAVAEASAATQAAHGPLASRILAALAEAPANPDELAQRLSLLAPTLAPELLDLELAGAIQLERDGRYWVAKGVGAGSL